MGPFKSMKYLHLISIYNSDKVDRNIGVATLRQIVGYFDHSNINGLKVLKDRIIRV
jgi:hypothetical protein